MTTPTPFNSELLDNLLAKAGIEWLLATSRANTRYLLGGHEYFFQAGFDAIGISRYLPVVGYRQARPSEAFYVASPHERAQLQLEPVWVERLETAEVASLSAVAAATAAIGRHPTGRIAIERSFLPVDAFEDLVKAFPHADFVDATEILEELRARKNEAELDLLRRASEAIVDAMLATFQGVSAGDSKSDIARHFTQEVINRGLRFDYAWIATGPSRDRTPIGGSWQPGEILSLDSGGQLNGYIGDLCRMAIMGEPTAEAIDRLEAVRAVQDEMRSAIKAGVSGSAVIEAGQTAKARSPYREHMRAIAHGMGLVSHEAPRLTKTGIPYPAAHASRPLESGMVLSVETYVSEPGNGFIKLEDTVFVTDTGYEAVGDAGRGWNRSGASTAGPSTAKAGAHALR